MGVKNSMPAAQGWDGHFAVQDYGPPRNDLVWREMPQSSPSQPTMLLERW
jgi:hypothetical protein